MTPHAAVLLPLLVLGGCSCSDELAVGSLGDDAGPDWVPGLDAAVAPPSERPCGVAERRLSFALPGDGPFGTGRIVLHGHGDALLAARWVSSAESGALELFRMDLVSEEVTLVGSTESALQPQQIRVHDGYQILLSNPDRWGLVTFRPDGTVGPRIENDFVDISHLSNAIPTGRGFVAEATGADGRLLIELTPDGIGKGPHISESFLLLGGDETRDLAALRMQESPGRAEVALVDTAEPLPADLTWSTAYATDAESTFRGSAAIATEGQVVVALLVSERIGPEPSYSPTELRVSWMDGARTIAEWTGWEGVAGQVWLAGTRERMSIFGDLWPEDTGEPSSGALAHGLISEPGEVGAVRVLDELGTTTPVSPVAWVTEEGGHAIAFTKYDTIHVFVSCEGAEP